MKHSTLVGVLLPFSCITGFNADSKVLTVFLYTITILTVRELGWADQRKYT